MPLLSVNVAQPHEVEIQGKIVATGIDKLPVPGRVHLAALGLEGDGQADHSVHGGPHQAVYAYPHEHYAHWAAWLGRAELPFGTFGENFTVSGLLETEVNVGDVLAVGRATVQVTMPRLPCFKFAHKVGRTDILKPFLQSGHSGFYLRVLTEGEVGAGDEIRILHRDPAGLSIRTALGLQKLGEGDAVLLRHALTIDSLAPLLHRDFSARLAALE